MAENDKQNAYLYKSALFLRDGLADVQKSISKLYQIEELEDYVDIKDSPIEHLQAAVSPLIEQVNDFLDYAHVVTNTMELTLDEMDIYAMLDSVMTIADQLVERKGGIRLEEDVAKNLPTIDADPMRLSQALLNYIHNAIKFTDSGDITVRIQKEGNHILFEVKDTGIGIADENQELVFEPFETILEDKTDSRLGFGLGLKIVEHIIELHGGETWFESKLDNGSSFFFSIPV